MEGVAIAIIGLFISVSWLFASQRVQVRELENMFELLRSLHNSLGSVRQELEQTQRELRESICIKDEES